MKIFKRGIFVFSFKRFFVKHFYADITLRIHFYYKHIFLKYYEQIKGSIIKVGVRDRAYKKISKK